MIQTFKIVTILQGLFLLIILYKNRRDYTFNNYFYLTATLVSLLIYLIGDNTTYLFISDIDIFLFDNTIFITFLLLFVKNFNSQNPVRYQDIVLYSIPALFYCGIEIYEIFFGETESIETVEYFLYLIFVVYLMVTFYYILKLNVSGIIKVPFYLLVISLLINYSSVFFSFEGIDFIAVNTVLIFINAFVFYYLTYLLVFNLDFIKQKRNTVKYQKSSLNSEDIEGYKKRIIDAMENGKVFTNENLSLQTFSEYIHIPKHYISEVLNVHLNTNFQDFVNEYRVEEFLKLYTDPVNDHYSILGLASSVGFKNKATFNYNFKKIKGLSPTEYKLKNKL